MAYRALRDISVLSIGRAWRRGHSIGDNEIPTPIRDNLLKEGCIEFVVNAPRASAPQSAKRQKCKTD